MFSNNINLSEDSSTLLELCKLMNFKLNRGSSDFLNPSKEMFIEVRQHCLQILLSIINSQDNLSKSIQSPLGIKNNNFKAYIAPPNNGKLV
jgi:hypothetical protein